MEAYVGGNSDPYCVFFTNPPDLLSVPRHAPATTAKRASIRFASSKKAADHRSATADVRGLTSAGSDTPASSGKGNVEAGPGRSCGDQHKRATTRRSIVDIVADAALGDRPAKPLPPTVFVDKELPLLRPRGISPTDLPFVSLIIAVCCIASRLGSSCLAPLLAPSFLLNPCALPPNRCATSMRSGMMLC